MVIVHIFWLFNVLPAIRRYLGHCDGLQLEDTVLEPQCCFIYGIHMPLVKVHCMGKGMWTPLKYP